MFSQEFCKISYPDHEAEKGESSFAFFKRSFEKYQRFRHLFGHILRQTRALTGKDQTSLLSPFSERRPHKIIQQQATLTFEVECFYKNFKDMYNDVLAEVFGFTQMFMNPYSNFIMGQISFQEHRLKAVILSPTSFQWVQQLIEDRSNFYCLPISITFGYRHGIF